MNLFNHSNRCCPNLIKGIIIKSIKEREVYKAECYFQEKIEVIVKENKNENDKDYTKREFNNTKLAYELCNDELSKIFENPIPKPICFDDNKLALSYIPGNSKEWPFINDTNKKMSDYEYKCAIKYLAKLHSIPIKENNKLEKSKYGGSNPISDKLRDNNEKLDSNHLSSYKEKLNSIYKNIPISLLENNSHDNNLVYSHGDFKPDNFIFSESLNNKDIFTNKNTNNAKKISMSAIDWIDFGLRLRQYDLGSLLFGIDDCSKLNGFLDLYLEELGINNFNQNDKKRFLKESIALACMVHINAPLSNNETEKAIQYIDYVYKIIGKINKM